MMIKSLFIKSTLLLVTGLALSQTNDPEKSKQYFNKGQQLFANVNYKGAVESYSLAIKEDSTNSNAWIRRGFTRGLLKDFEGELSDYTMVIKN